MHRQVVRHVKILCALGALVAGTATSANAATSTANLSVTATVAANCSISTSPLAFGAYDPVGANAASPLDGSATVTVNCTSGASTTITLDQGLNPNTGSVDSLPLRRMRDGGTSYLSYALFRDAGRTTVWGNTAGTGQGHTGTGTSTNVTVYGRVAAGQNVTAGSYSDTVVATITF